MVGLPCHVRGSGSPSAATAGLRERVVFSLGIFCGWSAQPRATELAARRLGVDPDDLADVRYRGPGWPGGLRLGRGPATRANGRIPSTSTAP